MEDKCICGESFKDPPPKDRAWRIIKAIYNSPFHWITLALVANALVNLLILLAVLEVI